VCLKRSMQTCKRESCSTKKIVDRAELLRSHTGQWVVLSFDETRVMASGTDLKEALSRVDQKQTRDVVVTYVPCGNSAMIL
jgi:CMP-N-acetylneuraminic acid synthetase